VSPISATSQPRPARVLLVEDSAEYRTMLRALLSRHEDLSVVGEAADGQEALGVVQRVAPDVVVTDLQMPGTGGLELTRLLRASRPDLPIVMLTGFPGPDVMDEAFSAGVSAFLEKATGAVQLPALLRDVLASVERGEVARRGGTSCDGTSRDGTGRDGTGRDGAGPRRGQPAATRR
jgi:DNA-binding NarL/FixJ family response regulator